MEIQFRQHAHRYFKKSAFCFASKVLSSKFSEMGMSRFPIMGMLKHNTDGEHYNSPFQGGEQVTGVPVPKSKGSPGVMQALKQGRRNSEIRNAYGNVHHLCLKRLGSGQRRQQKPSDCSWVPAEQVWDVFLQAALWVNHSEGYKGLRDHCKSPGLHLPNKSTGRRGNSRQA